MTKIVKGPWKGTPDIDVEVELKKPPQMMMHTCSVTVFELMDDGSIVCPRCDEPLQEMRWHEIKKD